MKKILTFAVLFGLTASPVLAHETGEAHAHGSTQAAVGVNVGTGINVDVSSETKAETGATAETTTENGTEAVIELGADPIVITASDAEDTEASVHSTAEVNSKATLNSYASTVVKGNADVRDITITDEHVAVSHREYARLFGILPIKVFARAYVKNNGEVEVTFPWYAFASAKKTSLESRIKTAVDPTLAVNASASAQLSAQTQAEVLAKTVAAMRAEFDADASAKVE